MNNFSIELVGPQKRSYNSQNICQKTLWTLYIVWRGLSYSKKSRKNWLKQFFLLKKYFFFQKPVFPISFWVLMKRSYTLHHNWQITLSGLETCYSTPAIMKKTKKNGLNLFFQPDESFFGKHCSNDFFCTKKWYYIKRRKVKIPFGTFSFCSMRSFVFDIRKKKPAIIVFYMKGTFFLKICVFINLLGVTEKTLQLAGLANILCRVY